MTAPRQPSEILSRAALNTSTTRSIAGAIVGQPPVASVGRRWGTISGINANGTVDVMIGGTETEGIARDANYTPSIGEEVYIDIVGADAVVAGTTAPSGLNPPPPYVPPLNRMNQRLGTITAVDATQTLVSVKLDDNSVKTNVPTLASYHPMLNDTVQVVQVQGTYLVIGSTNETSRTYRRAVGDIEPALAVKDDTLVCNGQVVSRSTYARLWSWVQTNSLVKTGLFTSGDGSTTFGLPDWRGRTALGAGVFAGVTYNVGDLVGAASQVLSTAQMPSHDHNVAVAAHGTHDHSISASTSGAGSHGHDGTTGTMDANWNHAHGLPVRYSTESVHTHAGMPGTVPEGPNPAGTLPPAAAGTYGTDTNHRHGFSTSVASAHTHSVSVDAMAVSAGSHAVTESTVGGTTPVDVRSPAFVINWLIWF